MPRGRLNLAGTRVLLAEDNPVTGIVLAKLLESHGMVVDVVASGSEAVNRWKLADYAVVLMDCQLSEMDGYAATRQIREWESGRRIRTPVIAITALATEGVRQGCVAAGMDDYLVKPFAPGLLFDCIEAHLGKQRGAVSSQ